MNFPSRDQRLLGFAFDANAGDRLHQAMGGAAPSPETQRTPEQRTETGVSQPQVDQFLGEVQGRIDQNTKRLSGLPGDFRNNFQKHIAEYLVTSVPRFDQNRNRVLETSGDAARNEFGLYKAEMLEGVDKVLAPFLGVQDRAEVDADQRKREAEMKRRTLDEQMRALEAEMEKEDPKELEETPDAALTNPQEIEERMREYDERAHAVRDYGNKLSLTHQEVMLLPEKWQEYLKPTTNEAVAAGGAVAAGAAIGSFIPVIGTVIGAGIGAAVYAGVRALQMEGIRREQEAKAKVVNEKIQTVRTQFAEAQKKLTDVHQTMEQEGAALRTAPERLREEDRTALEERRQEIRKRRSEVYTGVQEGQKAQVETARREVELGLQQEQLKKAQEELAERLTKTGSAQEQVREQAQEAQTRRSLITVRRQELEAQLQNPLLAPEQRTKLEQALKELQQGEEQGTETTVAASQGQEKLSEQSRKTQEGQRAAGEGRRTLDEQRIKMEAATENIQEFLGTLDAENTTLTGAEQSIDQFWAQRNEELDLRIQQVSEGVTTALLGNHLTIGNTNQFKEDADKLPTFEPQSTFEVIWSHTFEAVGQAWGSVWKGLGSGVQNIFGENAVTNFIAGLSEAVGAFGEGMMHMAAHPVEAAKGIVAMVNVFDWENFTKTYSGLWDFLTAKEDFDAAGYGLEGASGEKAMGKSVGNFLLFMIPGYGAIGNGARTAAMAFHTARIAGGGVVNLAKASLAAGVQFSVHGVGGFGGKLAKMPFDMIKGIAHLPIGIARSFRRGSAARSVAELSALDDVRTARRGLREAQEALGRDRYLTLQEREVYLPERQRVLTAAEQNLAKARANYTLVHAEQSVSGVSNALDAMRVNGRSVAEVAQARGGFRALAELSDAELCRAFNVNPMNPFAINKIVQLRGQLTTLQRFTSQAASSRIRLGETVLGRELSPAEAEALMHAHKLPGFGRGSITHGQTRAKYEEMIDVFAERYGDRNSPLVRRRAREDIRRLMDEGVAGNAELHLSGVADDAVGAVMRETRTRTTFLDELRSDYDLAVSEAPTSLRRQAMEANLRNQLQAEYRALFTEELITRQRSLMEKFNDRRRAFSAAEEVELSELNRAVNGRPDRFTRRNTLGATLDLNRTPSRTPVRTPAPDLNRTPAVPVPLLSASAPAVPLRSPAPDARVPVAPSAVPRVRPASPPLAAPATQRFPKAVPSEGVRVNISKRPPREPTVTDLTQIGQQNIVLWLTRTRSGKVRVREARVIQMPGGGFSIAPKNQPGQPTQRQFLPNEIQVVDGGGGNLCLTARRNLQPLETPIPRRQIDLRKATVRQPTQLEAGQIMGARRMQWVNGNGNVRQVRIELTPDGKFRIEPVRAPGRRTTPREFRPDQIKIVEHDGQTYLAARLREPKPRRALTPEEAQVARWRNQYGRMRTRELDAAADSLRTRLRKARRDPASAREAAALERELQQAEITRTIDDVNNELDPANRAFRRNPRYEGQPVLVEYPQSRISRALGGAQRKEAGWQYICGSKSEAIVGKWNPRTCAYETALIDFGTHLAREMRTAKMLRGWDFNRLNALQKRILERTTPLSPKQRQFLEHLQAEINYRVQQGVASNSMFAPAAQLKAAVAPTVRVGVGAINISRGFIQRVKSLFERKAAPAAAPRPQSAPSATPSVAATASPAVQAPPVAPPPVRTGPFAPNALDTVLFGNFYDARLTRGIYNPKRWAAQLAEPFVKAQRQYIIMRRSGYGEFRSHLSELNTFSREIPVWGYVHATVGGVLYYVVGYPSMWLGNNIAIRPIRAIRDTVSPAGRLNRIDSRLNDLNAAIARGPASTADPAAVQAFRDLILERNQLTQQRTALVGRNPQLSTNVPATSSTTPIAAPTIAPSNGVPTVPPPPPPTVPPNPSSSFQVGLGAP